MKQVSLAVCVGALLSAAGLSARAGAEEVFACELRQARGLDEDDARSAAQILCAELKQASSARGSYDIALAPLGQRVIVTVSRRESGESVTVPTDGVEEIPAAAPRIAEALVQHRPLADTQRVGNLLVDETGPILTKQGDAKFFAGVAHVQSPGLGASGASMTLGMMYAGERFSLPLGVRFGWAGDGGQKPRLHFFSASVGGRGYLTRRDISPYLGAGLGLLTLDADVADASRGEYFSVRTGLGTYLEVGVEALRLHRARVALAIRADIPTYPLRSEAYDGWDPATGRLDDVRTPGRTKYVWPVSIGVSVAF